MHEEFGEEIGLQHSLKERKGRGLGFFFTCSFTSFIL